jgi:polyprenyl-phospho-N-acetylgalactosaminyl synthase
MVQVTIPMQEVTKYRLFYIIRAFNEAAVIGQTITDLKHCAPSGEIIVVDDGSSDDTGSVALSSGAVVLRHFVNRGGGAALQTGLTYARLNHADIVVTFDADGQHDAKDVAALIEPIVSGKYDVVLASRFLDSSSTSNMPWLRWWTLKAGVIFTRLMSRVHVTDTHNGLRAFSGRAISLMHTSLDDMAYASEIYDEIYRGKLSYKEVPCHIRYTDYSLAKGQRSTAAIRIAWRFFLEKIRP